MAFVKKFVRGVRTHWKKSTFAACLLTYGGRWLKEKYDIDQLMRVYCEEAMRYGEVAISGTVSPRSITVILNPAANKRSAVNDFESYCSPILNLAGICIDVLQTESEGHAKELVQGINATDAVVVAGGDGTLAEVITGLLRRTGESNADLVPIGVLPLGAHNSIGSVLFPGGNHLTKVKSLADAALAIVQEVTKPMDVMKIEIIDDEDVDAKKPVYALSGIEWGAYRDASVKRDKYWYYGPLRKYVTYIFNGYKNNLCWKINAVINYTPPCDGCSNCTIKQDDLSNKRWYHRIFSTRQVQTNDRSSIINKNCNHLQEKQVSTADLALLTSNIIPRTLNGPPKLHLNLGPDNLDYMNFVTEGWKTENGHSREVKERIEARQIIIRPNVTPEDGEVWFSIDKEDFEVKPVRITLLPNLINMFCKKDTT